MSSSAEMFKRVLSIKWARIGVFLAVILASSPAWADQILVSQSADRSFPAPLQDAVIFGDVFIFFVTPEIEISVQFFIDGKLQTTDNLAPYDLVGENPVTFNEALPFDTRLMKALKGTPTTHKIDVLMTFIDGTVRQFSAVFIVDNSLAPYEEVKKSLQVVSATPGDIDGDGVADILLTGFNLNLNVDKGVKPQVALDTRPLKIQFFDEQTLVATLPAGPLVGDHLVNVSMDGNFVPGLQDSEHAELLVTFGATDLSCVGCVSAPEVSFSYAGSSRAGGKAFEAIQADFAMIADFALTAENAFEAERAEFSIQAGNAELLGGVDSSDFARVAVTQALDSRVTANDGAIAALESGVGVGVGGQSNPLQVALLRWYDVNQTGLSFPVGSFAIAVAFDGANIWVANALSSNVTKLRASDGANLGTFPTGGIRADGVAFDGANIWVANQISGNVTKLRASDGANLGIFLTGGSPFAIAFDGANIWASNRLEANVTKLRASDGPSGPSGEVLGIFDVGTEPRAVAFDGANIWVSNFSSFTVTKLRASDGANLGTFPVGPFPGTMAFDGANIWVTSAGSNNVTKLRASDGANLGTFDVGAPTGGMAFDGANIWVTHGNNVTKLRPRDGANLGTFDVGRPAGAVAFDGVNLWVTNGSDNTVSKL